MNYQHPLVRDLAWCLFSPELMQGSTPLTSEIDKAHLQLQRLDHQPAPLERWMSARAVRRLGFRFEALWHYWLTHSDEHSGLEHQFNLQLSAGGKTVGELDCLSFDGDHERLVHRELAVKFYLAVTSDRLPEHWRSDEPIQYIGVGARDRLDLKHQQLFEKQRHHLESTEHWQHLPDRWQGAALHTEVHTRGRIFYPWDDTLAEVATSRYLHPNHLRSVWLPLSEFASLPVGQWRLLEKPQWFAPIQRDDSVIDHRQLIDLEGHSLSTQLPLQIARFDPDSSTREEVERYFVVPDHWPLTTRPSR